MDYPDEQSENKLTRHVINGEIQAIFKQKENTRFSGQDILKLQELCGTITLDNQIIDYAVRLCRATRETSMLVQGAGPRATISLAKAARAKALLNGRDHVLPDDIKALYLPVLRHRVTLSAESEIDGLKADDILTRLLENTEAPR